MVHGGQCDCGKQAIDWFRGMPLCGECIGELASMNSENEEVLADLLACHFAFCFACGYRYQRGCVVCPHCGSVLMPGMLVSGEDGEKDVKEEDDGR